MCHCTWLRFVPSLPSLSFCQLPLKNSETHIWPFAEGVKHLFHKYEDLVRSPASMGKMEHGDTRLRFRLWESRQEDPGACQRAARLVRSSVVRDLVSKYKEKDKMERN